MVAILRAPGSTRGLSFIWSSDVDAVAGSSDHKWKAEADLEITGWIAVCADSDPPVGADLVYDIARVGGPSLYATNPADRPTIADGQSEGVGAAPGDAVILEGDSVVASILQPGLALPGSKPDLRVFYKLL